MTDPQQLGGHLDEVALEALATGRDDLIDEASLDHLDECADCAELVARERLGAEDASVALRRAMPELDDLDSMVAQAMAVAADAEGAPSRRSLWLGAGFGATVAVALGVLSIPTADSVSGLSAVGRQLLTLTRALDRVVESSLPGGWIGVALMGLALSLLLAVPTRLLLRGARPRPGAIITGALSLALLGIVSLPTSAAYAYRVDGGWPQPMPTVTVDVENQPLPEALRQATQSAGLGVVVRLPDDEQRITLHVEDAPMDEVFEAILGDQDVVVRPGSSLVNVRPDSAPSDSAPSDSAPSEVADPANPFERPDEPGLPVPSWEPVHARPPEPSPGFDVVDVPPVPPAPSFVPVTRPGARTGVGDRVTFGDDVVIGPDEVVRGVYTMGGDADIDGRALGDVVTMGGDAEIIGEVIGNVTTMGGDISLADGARVHGDLNAMGGEIDIADAATVYGQVLANPSGSAHHAESSDHPDGGKRPFAGFFRWGLFNALVFLFGLFMLGTNRKRFNNLRTELGSRPVRSAFGGFFGGMAGLVLTVVLCLTVLGIPGAMVLVFLLVVAVGVGWTTSAWWLGGALPFGSLKDRPVVQLAAGVGILFVFGLVPKVGSLLVIGAVLAGLGAVIATEFGARQRQPKKPKHVPTGPFRTSA